ncbi:primosomal protein N' [Deltaproteobacteria bacterium Smac51]|nr:primosomal protein N' [Deltaproteobacteria bacterium Smac51]
MVGLSGQVLYRAAIGRFPLCLEKPQSKSHMTFINPNPLLAQVAVDAAVPEFYTYLIPTELEEEAAVGQAAVVPLGRREVVGYLMALGHSGRDSNDPSMARLRPIRTILRPEPLFGPSLSRLINFISHYYFYPPGLCAKDILPGGLSPKTEDYITLSGDQPARTLLGEEAELLARLADAPPDGLAVTGLEKEGFAAAIKKLASAGSIRRTCRLAGKSSRMNFEWWVGPAENPPETPPRLGPKERELWELVNTGPAKPMSYYASYIKDPLTKARSLEAKGLAVLSQKEIFRDDPERAIFQDHAPAPKPTAQQAAALEPILSAIREKRHQGFLLFGVTGSGKTEVYLRAAAETLTLGREVLWLAPEIGLTMGLEGLLRNRLGTERVAVLHSALTPGQRHDQWLRIRRGLAPVVLGARSAVFAPLENLGLVVVDEEHDWAYKQDDGLRYNGRDLAMWRAREAGAALILGSATPSLENYQAALNGRLTLLTMKDRAGAAILPEVELLNQSDEPARLRKVLSPPLRKDLSDTLDRGEQALLFINRRGMANLPMCLACGEALKCPHCSRTLTLHGPAGRTEAESEGNLTHAAIDNRQVLVCHSCGYRAEPPKACPACLSPLFRYFGVGTEKLLKMAEDDFPQVRGSRLDTDSVRRRGGLKGILQKFASGEFNLLVGTQMAAKGHDFPNLTLVGVVDADLGLNLPDFRAAERTFQLLSQVAGRAGRSDTPGRVLVQTMVPGHPVLQAVAHHDYEEFYQQEIEVRAELGFPPFSRLALIRISGPDETHTAELAAKGADLARLLMKDMDDLDLFGPAPSPIARIKDLYRYQFQVRAGTVATRRKFLEAWLPRLRAIIPPNVRMIVDIDPYQLL